MEATGEVEPFLGVCAEIQDWFPRDFSNLDSFFYLIFPDTFISVNISKTDQ